MNARQYHEKVKRFDRDREDRLAATIPLNINRAGKRYRQLLKQQRLVIH